MGAPTNTGYAAFHRGFVLFGSEAMIKPLL